MQYIELKLDFEEIAALRLAIEVFILENPQSPAAQSLYEKVQEASR